MAFLHDFNRLCDEVLGCIEEGEPPESPRAQALAGEFWKMVSEFTGGDQNMLERLQEMGGFDGADSQWQQRQAQVNAYIGPALEAYFQNQGIDPFKEEQQ